MIEIDPSRLSFVNYIDNLSNGNLLHVHRMLSLKNDTELNNYYQELPSATVVMLLRMNAEIDCRCSISC